MSTLLGIRSYPAILKYSDAAHQFFRPALAWQLKRAWLQVQREKLTGALVAHDSLGGAEGWRAE